MLARMLDWKTILWCHTRVPVYYWPVLWYWLRRLEDTYTVYAEEGRRFFRWHLERDGRIWIEYCDESDAERAMRGALAPEFDRTPWDRLAPVETAAPGFMIIDAARPVTHPVCFALPIIGYLPLHPP